MINIQNKFSEVNTTIMNKSSFCCRALDKLRLFMLREQERQVGPAERLA